MSNDFRRTHSRVRLPHSLMDIHESSAPIAASYRYNPWAPLTPNLLTISSLFQLETWFSNLFNIYDVAQKFYNFFQLLTLHSSEWGWSSIEGLNNFRDIFLQIITPLLWGVIVSVLSEAYFCSSSLLWLRVMVSALTETYWCCSQTHIYPQGSVMHTQKLQYCFVLQLSEIT